MERSTNELERGRQAYAKREWKSAHAALTRADESEPLEAADVVLLATTAYMLGLDDEWERYLERAHHGYAEAGETLPAVRCAFWLGMSLALRGEVGPATGWIGRANRLLEQHGGDEVERGYLLLPLIFRHEASGDLEAAEAVAGEAAGIGVRVGDPDLFALATHAQGHLLVRQGRVDEGLGLLDEAMVAVTSGEPSPMITGFVYCGVILTCQQVFELRRAREWTSALSAWCGEQPDLVAFTGRCLVHRAEILQLHGSWSEALEEARRAGTRLSEGFNRAAAADAFYRQGELHRLRGDLVAAEDNYREASRFGREPQPGYALLRLAQGKAGAASVAIRRALGEATEPLARAALLPAAVEIELAAGQLDEARSAADELTEIAEEFRAAYLTAASGQARGAVELAAGRSQEALAALRPAAHLWLELEAPYETASTRVLLGRACRALGDEDSASLELEGARDAFERLEAAPDVARVDALVRDRAETHGLTRRELEVLRLLAAGSSNREIAGALVLSERTVDRHVGNIFTKLRVSSRAAATAYAYQNRLL